VAPPEGEHVFVSDRKPTLRASGLLVQDRHLLMVKQARGGEEYWLLPGGGVEYGETLAEALRREFLEELGMRVSVNRLLAIVESISPDPSYPKHVVHMMFEVSAAREVPPEARDASILAVAFFDEVEVRNADVRPPINEFLCACTRELPKWPQYIGRRW
jgi:8-oxo-dGTP diphosphatase